MPARGYRLGRRQHAVDRTAAAILGAARRLVAIAPASKLSVGAVAREAGVSRITVYNRFGSRAGLIAAVAPNPIGGTEDAFTDARGELRSRLTEACAHWSVEPALHRNLNLPASPAEGELARRLAEGLAAEDALRPGCSIREAEDVIGALIAFPVFDRLHRDGRRPAGAVAEILWRLASSILR
ncbi:MAG TPA: helix-turn-helix domain-containing protein [Patescibacteria group bacterium]|nr:helix-turn-helix domain-containing protein [Patescibacteria group bacterium]